MSPRHPWLLVDATDLSRLAENRKLYLRLAMSTERILELRKLVAQVQEIHSKNPRARALLLEDPAAEFVVAKPDTERDRALDEVGEILVGEPGADSVVRGRMILEASTNRLVWGVQNGGIGEARSNGVYLSTLSSAWCLVCPGRELPAAWRELIHTSPLRAATWAAEGRVATADGFLAREIRPTRKELSLLLASENAGVRERARHAVERL